MMSAQTPFMRGAELDALAADVSASSPALSSAGQAGCFPETTERSSHRQTGSEVQAELLKVLPELKRFARFQLRDDHAAEDVVQEVVVAVLANGASFEGRSAFKTWAFTILRNKIVDLLRSRSRESPIGALANDEDGDDYGDELIDSLFDKNGHWRPEAKAARWAEPDKAFEQHEFWQVLAACIDGLPPRMGRVFAMREILELETDEICKDLGITPSNCWVTLHRARLAIRTCLDLRWFQGNDEMGVSGR